MKTYNLFISHSWRHSDAYERLVNLLDNRSYFAYRNYSVPRNDPVHTRGTDRELREAIKRQMSYAHVIVILAGVYATYSKWINNEIRIAQRGFQNSKPILAIQPRGSERISTVVQDAADIIVRWNTESIVGAIRELG